MHAMSCHSMSCDVMAWHDLPMAFLGMPWHAMARSGVPCLATSCRAKQWHDVELQFYAVTCHVMACQACMPRTAMNANGQPWTAMDGSRVAKNEKVFIKAHLILHQVGLNFRYCCCASLSHNRLEPMTSGSIRTYLMGVWFAKNLKLDIRNYIMSQGYIHDSTTKMSWASISEGVSFFGKIIKKIMV